LSRALKIRGNESKVQVGHEPFLCFERQSSGDVVFVSEDVAKSDATLSQIPASMLACKILGSAQRRYRGAVLQHGSLLLERSPAAPELVGWRDLSEQSVATEAIISAVADRLGATLHLQLREAKMPPEPESKAAQLANHKYGSPTWTKRR
jgi:lipoate-protein ligase A